jgi:hypothetical protein
MDAYRNFVEFTELGSIGLTQKTLGRIEQGRGRRIRVESGQAWITHERRDEDVILGAGQSYEIPVDGTTLVSALRVTFALVTIDPALPLPPTRAERFWKLWAGFFAPESRPTTAAL